MLSMPKGLCAASGIDVLTHALESLVATVATEYTIPLSLESAKLVFDYLPESYHAWIRSKKLQKKKWLTLHVWQGWHSQMQC